MYEIIQTTYKGLIPVYKVYLNGVQIYFSFDESDAQTAVNYHKRTGFIR